MQSCFSTTKLLLAGSTLALLAGYSYSQGVLPLQATNLLRPSPLASASSHSVKPALVRKLKLTELADKESKLLRAGE